MAKTNSPAFTAFAFSHHIPNYADDGCEYSPSCLTCPLPLCKYDDPLHHPSTPLRNATLYQEYLSGDTVNDIAARHRLSTRTINRIVQLRGAPGLMTGPSPRRGVLNTPSGAARPRPHDETPSPAAIIAILSRPAIKPRAPLPPLFARRGVLNTPSPCATPPATSEDARTHDSP